MNSRMLPTPLRPKLMSFDVFGTLISVRDSSYSAFELILADARHLDVKATPRRRPSGARLTVVSVIHHSDQGSQLTLK